MVLDELTETSRSESSTGEQNRIAFICWLSSVFCFPRSRFVRWEVGALCLQVAVPTHGKVRAHIWWFGASAKSGGGEQQEMDGQPPDGPSEAEEPENSMWSPNVVLGSCSQEVGDGLGEVGKNTCYRCC